MEIIEQKTSITEISQWIGSTAEWKWQRRKKKVTEMEDRTIETTQSGQERENRLKKQNQKPPERK